MLRSQSGTGVFAWGRRAAQPQRAAENTPGQSSPISQNLDAAAVYFLEDAGRGGFSGYLASESVQNEWLTSSALKTLVGYPTDPAAGILPDNYGQSEAQVSP